MGIVHARHLQVPLLQLVEELQSTLSRRLVLLWVDLREFRVARQDLVDDGAVLHGTAAEGVEET